MHPLHHRAVLLVCGLRSPNVGKKRRLRSWIDKGAGTQPCPEVDSLKLLFACLRASSPPRRSRGGKQGKHALVCLLLLFLEVLKGTHRVPLALLSPVWAPALCGACLHLPCPASLMESFLSFSLVRE